MVTVVFHLVAMMAVAGQPLGPGNHDRSLTIGDANRSYVVHIPPKYNGRKPMPVVLALHGAGMSGRTMMAVFGFNKKADDSNFIVVYPNGSGLGGLVLTWNSGGVRGMEGQGANDVAFIGKVLDDLNSVARIDRKRIYATGMSNGAMMCYRLAAELSDRIAAIAPVAGTMAVAHCEPKRPVPVLHFHGTADNIIPYDGLANGSPKLITVRSVQSTIETWVKLNACPVNPQVEELPCKIDDLKVVKKTYGPGKLDAEVVLYAIEGGGHTWPGRRSPVQLIGKSTLNISANDLIWEFFEKHPMP